MLKVLLTLSRFGKSDLDPKVSISVLDSRCFHNIGVLTLKLQGTGLKMFSLKKCVTPYFTAWTRRRLSPGDSRISWGFRPFKRLLPATAENAYMYVRSTNVQAKKGFQNWFYGRQGKN